MAPVLSRDAGEAAKEKNLRVLYAAAFLQIGSAVILMQSTPMVVASHFKGAGKLQQTKTLQTLNRMASGAAFLEFLLNPIFGRLSDQYGRKVFLLLAPIATIVLRAAVVKSPSMTSVAVARLALGALIPAFVTSLTASIADMFRAGGTEKLAGTSGLLYVTMGLAVIISSIFGGRLAARDIRLPYAVSCGLGAAALLLVLTQYKETLVEGERRKEAMTVEEVNPFNFLRLFQKSRTLAKMNLVTAMQAMPANMGDVQQAFGRLERGWGPGENGKFMATLGLGAMVSGGLTGRFIRQLGRKEYSTVTNLAAVLTYYLFGIANTKGMAYFAALFAAISQMRSSAISATITKLGAAQGYGQGQLAADRANLAAVVKVASPLLSASLFGLGARKGVTGLPFFFMAALLVAAQGILFSIPDKSWSAKEERLGAK